MRWLCHGALSLACYCTSTERNLFRREFFSTRSQETWDKKKKEFQRGVKFFRTKEKQTVTAERSLVPNGILVWMEAFVTTELNLFLLLLLFFFSTSVITCFTGFHNVIFAQGIRHNSFPVLRVFAIGIRSEFVEFLERQICLDIASVDVRRVY